MTASENGLKSKSASLKSLSSLSSFSFSKSKQLNLSPDPIASTEALYQAQDVQLTKQRCRAAALGALVADAACQGLYWVPDKELPILLSRPEHNATPEFRDLPDQEYSSPGSLSPVGDELLPLLQSLVYHGGLDGVHYTQTAYDFLRKYEGPKTELGSRFVTSVARGNHFPAGLHYSSLQCLTKVPLLVARFAGKPELEAKLKDAVRAQQSSSDACSTAVAAAQILERVVLGASILEALSWAQNEGVKEPALQKQIQAVLKSLSVPHAVFVAKNGRSERLPGAFLGSLHAAAIAESYQDGIRQTLRAGGASCGRAHLVGALLAAQDGLSAIPEGWREQVTKFKEYNDLIDKLVAQRAIILTLLWAPGLDDVSKVLPMGLS